MQSKAMAQALQRSLVVGLSLVATAAGAQDREVLAKLSGFWMAKFVDEPHGQALIDELPKGTHLLVDTFSVPELPIGDFGGLKVTPRVLEEVKTFNPAAQRGPSEACVPQSLTYVMQAPFPMEVYATPELIVFKMEYYDMVRIVFMDGRKHPGPDAPHTKAGHSVGHWEGADLVVDTTHVAGATFFNNGFNHSDDIHVVERFRMSPDGKTLWITQAYEDPATFEGRAGRYMAFARGPEDGYVYPFDCDPGYATGD
jgi:hypothetical protein